LHEYVDKEVKREDKYDVSLKGTIRSIHSACANMNTCDKFMCDMPRYDMKIRLSSRNAETNEMQGERRRDYVRSSMS